MARWAPFLALVVALTIAVLLLARQSTGLLQDASRARPPLAEPTARQPGVGEEPADRPAEPGGAVDLSSGILLGNVLVTQGFIAAIVLAAIGYFAVPWTAVGLPGGPLTVDPEGLVLGVALGVGLWLASEVAGRLADAAGLAYDERLRTMLAPGTVAGWLSLFLVVLPVIAIAEELLFRAALIGGHGAGLGLSPWLLVVVSSGLFALGHGAQGRVGIAATGALGLVLGGAFVVTDRLIVVVAAHYVVNALEFGAHELLGTATTPTANQ